MCGVLGLIVVEKENSIQKKCQVIVSNHLSIFDHVALHLATGSFAVCISFIFCVFSYNINNFEIRIQCNCYKRCNIIDIINTISKILNFYTFAKEE